MKNIESKTLENWIIELTEERKNYYLEKKRLLNQLRELSHSISSLVRSESDKLYKRDNGFSETHYLELYEIMLSHGVEYDKEQLITSRRSSGTPYKTVFKDKEVFSYYKGSSINRSKSIMTYSISEYYFYNYESKALYEFLTRDRFDAEKDAAKEVIRYVDSILARIETTYGKVLNVRDSNRDGIANVEFECEKGDCYLYRILAGGYNIQRLHNRILLKEVK